MISVIITTYKRSEFLPLAIESVLNQGYKNFEVLVVDDNGNDGEDRKNVELIMKKYEENSKVLYLKYDENKGACFARNYGIKNSKGEYIAFLDDDDEFYPTKLEKMYKLLVKNKEKKVGIVCSRMNIFDAVSGKKIRKSIYNGKEGVLYNLYDYLSGKVIIQGTSTLIFVKEALEKVQGFTEIPSYQEAYVIAKVLNAGYYGMVLNECLVKYKDHLSDKKSVGKGERTLIGREKYFEFYLELIKKLKKETEKKEAEYYYNYLNFNYQLNLGVAQGKKELKKMLKYKILKKENLKAIVKLWVVLLKNKLKGQ